MIDVRFILDVLSKRRQVRAREHWTRQQLEVYQANTLQSLRKYAYDNSPFYQKFHKGLYDAPLEKLPVLTKAILMEHFDELVTDRDINLFDIKEYMADQKRSEFFHGRYIINATSGSSGRLGVSIFNKSEWAILMASALARTPLQLSITHRIKTAQIASTTSFHMMTQGGKTFQHLLMPELMLSASEPLTDIVKKLKTGNQIY